MYKFLTFIFLSGLAFCTAKQQKLNIEFYGSNESCLTKINSTDYIFIFKEYCNYEDDCINRIIGKHDYKNSIINYSNSSFKLDELNIENINGKCLNIGRLFYSYHFKINYDHTFFLAASFTVGIMLSLIVVFIMAFIYYSSEFKPVKMRRGFKYSTFSVNTP